VFAFKERSKVMEEGISHNLTGIISYRIIQYLRLFFNNNLGFNSLFFFNKKRPFIRGEIIDNPN